MIQLSHRFHEQASGRIDIFSCFMCPPHTDVVGTVKCEPRHRVNISAVICSILPSLNFNASASIHLYSYLALHPPVHSMADPLSITASIIAVVTAIEGVSKTLAKIRNAHNAPYELSALVNEVSNLRIVLNDVYTHLESESSRPEPLKSIRHMVEVLERAKDTLLRLDQLIYRKLTKHDSTSANPKVSRYEWIKARSIIENYRQSLRDIKLDVIAQLAILNA